MLPGIILKQLYQFLYKHYDMKIISSKIPVLLFLVFALGCKQKETKEQAVDTIKRTDTILNQQPENTINTYASVDISPMDMSYFPVDYPKIKMANGAKLEPPVARVIYSRPHLQRRQLFNGVLKYDELWRLGANESTEIDFYKNVTIQGKKIKAGRYILYGIPHIDKWTIVLNSNIDTWGLKQDTTKDIARFQIPVSTHGASLEYFTMVFEKSDKGANLIIAWADVVAVCRLSFSLCPTPV